MNDKIIIKGAKLHNLKNIDVEIPRGKLVVFTGVSGSGKSSLVFDTIFAEGQRRFVESMSSYARQFLDRMTKADVELIEGICPAVAIEQKPPSKNPRSTVGTTTEVYDFLRLLFARIGKTYCVLCGKEVKKDTVGTVISRLKEYELGKKFLLTFLVEINGVENFDFEIDYLKRKGFFRFWQEGKIFDLNKNEIPQKGKNFYVIIERFKIKENLRDTLSDALEVTFKLGDGSLSIIDVENDEIKNFSNKFECCGITYEEPTPQFFSFNNPIGACPVCQGFGRVVGYDEDLIIPNPELSIFEGAIAPWRTPKFGKFKNELILFGAKKKIPFDIPYKDLSELHKNYIWKGFDDFPGIEGFFKILEKKTYKMHIRILLSKYKGYTTCSACKGTRIRRESLYVKIAGKTIADISKMTIKESFDFFNNLEISEYDKKVAGQILEEIRKRLRFLNEVGLGYLTLDRMSSTLSGGEAQRINLATSLGAALVGTLYVLDEPSIGLHPRDNERLIKILKSLRDLGNTVLVVEHDPEIMRNADYIFDMGPGAGKNGGEIIASGNYDEIINNGKSLTGKYLSGSEKIPIPRKRRTENRGFIKIYGAYENNLKKIDVEIPLNKFVVITGVSGSGKSSLINDVLYGNAVKLLGGNPSKIGKCKSIELGAVTSVEMIDQKPIGKSPRSNPISYVKGFEIIREIFASTSLAKAYGLTPGYFSFNIDGGRCETCKGEGSVKIEMQFLADLYLTCEDCKGTRYKKEILDIKYRGKNIVDVLNMTVNEALEFFYDIPKLNKYLRALASVGLGYIQLGQPSNTLSGGEAQRIKLASHIIKENSHNHTLFLFDEPTTGLHFNDIKYLINSFEILLQGNNSIVVIEHNLEIIKVADYIIDLGPEAGKEGGEIIAAGTPEEIAENPKSITGKFLKEILQEGKP